MTTASPAALQFGLDTFGDVTRGLDGELLTGAQTVRNVVEQGVLADAVGVDVFAVGEHHRDDYAVSAPDMVLSAIAGRTSRIHLSTAVTVLSSDDPVRVFERFSTLDAISNGRAEIIVGRGSFTESFPLFGFDLADYDVLFEEKLDLFAKLATGEPVTWSGTKRAPLDDVTLYPRLEHAPLPTWVAVGGTPQSVVRAAAYGLPLMLAIIGGAPARFQPFARLYRQASEKYGTGAHPIGMHSPGHIADTDEAALEQHYAAHTAMFARIGRERGWQAPATEAESRAQYEAEVRHGALYVGSPETVARKIAANVRAVGVERFALKYTTGTIAHEHSMRAIELYGEKVVPMVRELLAEGE